MKAALDNIRDESKYSHHAINNVDTRGLAWPPRSVLEKPLSGREQPVGREAGNFSKATFAPRITSANFVAITIG